MLLLPAFEGIEEQVKVSFSGLYARICENGCTKKYPTSAFGADLLTMLFWEPMLRLTAYYNQPGVRDWVSTSPPCCSYCDAPAQTLKVHPWKTSGLISIENLSPFQVSIELPIFTCRSCGVVQSIHDENQVNFLIDEAVVKAFDGIGLKL